MSVRSAFRYCQFAALAALSFALATPAAAQVRVRLAAWPEPVMLDTLRQEHDVNAKPEAVYEALQKAFAQLGIPVGNTDSKAGIIGSERFDKTTQLAGARMSLSFNCGNTANMENADHYRLTIVVSAWVKPGEHGDTKLAIASAASGADVSGVYRNPRECASTGWLETKIVSTVEKLAK